MQITTKASTENLDVRINDVDVNFNTYPCLIDNRVMIPVREVFETFGFEVGWDDKDRTAICTKDNNKVLFDVGKGCLVIDGKDVMVNPGLPVINGRVLAPEEMIEKGLGIEVKLDKKEGIVYFSEKSTGDISVSGSDNVVAKGEDIIVNISRSHSIDKVNEIITEADKLYDESNLVGAINKYKEVLKNISWAKNPEEYIYVMNNLGCSYVKLSSAINSEENLIKAISLFEEVLEKVDDNKFAYERAYTYKLSAAAYMSLSSVRDMESNASKAMSEIDEALKFFNKKIILMIMQIFKI